VLNGAWEGHWDSGVTAVKAQKIGVNWGSVLPRSHDHLRCWLWAGSWLGPLHRLRLSLLARPIGLLLCMICRHLLLIMVISGGLLLMSGVLGRLIRSGVTPILSLCGGRRHADEQADSGCDQREEWGDSEWAHDVESLVTMILIIESRFMANRISKIDNHICKNEVGKRSRFRQPIRSNGHFDG
jgi:hypothetical protein